MSGTVVHTFSMSDKPRPTKLKFKGDKTKKKRKRDDEDAGEGSNRRRRKDEDNDESPDTWVLPEQPNEIRGPTFIIHPSDPSPTCITYDSTRGKIVLHSLDKDVKAEGTEVAVSVMERTPTEVSQVWVITRVAGSATVNLRTGVGEGRFISCDKHGIVSADREPCGREGPLQAFPLVSPS